MMTCHQRLCHGFIFLLFVVLAINIQAQNSTDSLRTVLKTTNNDSVTVGVLNNLYLANDSIIYVNRALHLAQKAGYKKGIALSLLYLGRYYYFDGRSDSALSNLVKSVKIARESGDKYVLISAYRYLGYIYRPDDPFVAESYYNKSLKMAIESRDKLSESYDFSAIGNVYENIYNGNSDNNRKALSYYLQSLKIREKIGSDEEIASSLNETSRAYDELGQYNKEMKLRLEGLQYARKAHSRENVVFLSDMLGNDYSTRMHDYKKGLQYHLEAYSNIQAMKNSSEVLFNVITDVAHDYSMLGDYKKSNEYYLRAVAVNDSVNAVGARRLYNLSGLKNNLQKRLEKQRLLLKKSEIAKQKAEASRQNTLWDTSFVVFCFILLLAIILFRGNRLKQISNRELAIKNRKLEIAYRVLAASESKFKLITETIDDVFYLFNIVEKKYEYISPNCINLFGLSQEWIYQHNTSKSVVYKEDLPMVIEANQKVDSGHAYEIEYRVVVNGKTKWVAEKSSPIYDEKGNLVRNSGICRDVTQKKTNEEIIRMKNKDIKDSILYASTIQNAILVPKEKIAEKLGNFFILSKPKDIVSGDFYFYRETGSGFVIAIADCTGHGVPGGFMSMLGSAYLNEILNTYNAISPAQTLNELRKRVIKSLNQNTTYSSNKDGMDIALLRFDNNNTYVEYAGAFNPLYIIRKGKLKEYPADKYPIGIDFDPEQHRFTNNEIELQKGDMLYLFSDGYTDQFGGLNNKKFAKTRLKELFLSIQEKNMAEQEKILDKTFEDWKGAREQIDDVMVMGICV